MQPNRLYKHYTAGACRVESDGEECIDRAAFLEICRKQPFVTTRAVTMLGQSNSNFAAISGSNLVADYYLDPNSDKPCLLKLTATGVLRGTNTTISIVAEPANFAVNEKGEVFTTYARYLHAQ